MHVFISFTFTFMGTHQQLQVMFAQYAFCDVWAKITASPSEGIRSATRHRSGVAP